MYFISLWHREIGYSTLWQDKYAVKCNALIVEIINSLNCSLSFWITLELLDFYTLHISIHSKKFLCHLSFSITVIFGLQNVNYTLTHTSSHAPYLNITLNIVNIIYITQISKSQWPGVGSVLSNWHSLAATNLLYSCACSHWHVFFLLWIYYAY